MQLSSSVTKGNFAIKGEKKKISTSYNKSQHMSEEDIVGGVELNNRYSLMGEEIVEEAKREREKLLFEAMERAKEIERQAYEEGYQQGYTNAVEDGKKEVNEKIIPNARNISDGIIRNADEILKRASDDYNDYLIEKKSDIIDLAFTISEKILSKEIENKASFIEMINKAMEEAKGEKSILIRCHEDDIPYIEENIEKWKLTLNVKEGIFTIKENLNRGEVIIEKETGTIQVGIETGLKKIKKELLGR